jgi:hypothetical protein
MPKSVIPEMLMILEDIAWDPDQHPRADDGEFGQKTGPTKPPEPKTKKPKQPTYEVAKSNLLAHLTEQGWKVKEGLKIPHATSPDGSVRLWFKSQAIYFSNDKHDMSNASSLHSDIRKMTPEQFVTDAMKYAAVAKKSDAYYNK